MVQLPAYNSNTITKFSLMMPYTYQEEMEDEGLSSDGGEAFYDFDDCGYENGYAIKFESSSSSMRRRQPISSTERHLNEDNDDAVVPEMVRSRSSSSSTSIPITLYNGCQAEQGVCHGFFFPTVLKLTNISWDVRSSDIYSFCKDYRGSLTGVHIPIDRISGKTKNVVFLEFAHSTRCRAGNCRPDAGNGSLALLELRSGESLKNRPISISMSSVEELMFAHFPQYYKGESSTTGRKRPPVYLSKDEIHSIINVCRNYKIHFSRKCAERPFEHVMSILKLVPWHRLDVEGRNDMFELARGALEALRYHLSRPSCSIEPSLMARFRYLCTVQLKDILFDPEKVKNLESVSNSSLSAVKQKFTADRKRPFGREKSTELTFSSHLHEGEEDEFQDSNCTSFLTATTSCAEFYNLSLDDDEDGDNEGRGDCCVISE